jgi:hypothetical protein
MGGLILDDTTPGDGGPSITITVEGGDGGQGGGTTLTAEKQLGWELNQQARDCGLLGLGFAAMAFGNLLVADPFGAIIDCVGSIAASIESFRLLTQSYELLNHPPRWDVWASDARVSPYRPDPIDGRLSRDVRAYLGLSRQLRYAGSRCLEAVEKSEAAALAGEPTLAAFLRDQGWGWRERARAIRQRIAEVPRQSVSLSGMTVVELTTMLERTHRAAGRKTSPVVLATIVQLAISAS